MPKNKVHLGVHYILEFHDCKAELLNDVKFIEENMLKAARLSHGTILSHYFHKFEPIGVTGVVLIAESHLSIHTWPEYSYAAIDLFTCGHKMKPEVGFAHLKIALQSQRIRMKKIDRGEGFKLVR